MRTNTTRLSALRRVFSFVLALSLVWGVAVPALASPIPEDYALPAGFNKITVKVLKEDINDPGNPAKYTPVEGLTLGRHLNFNWWRYAPAITDANGIAVFDMVEDGLTAVFIPIPDTEPGKTIYQGYVWDEFATYLQLGASKREVNLEFVIRALKPELAGTGAIRMQKAYYPEYFQEFPGNDLYIEGIIDGSFPLDENRLIFSGPMVTGAEFVVFIPEDRRDPETNEYYEVPNYWVWGGIPSPMTWRTRPVFTATAMDRCSLKASLFWSKA